MEATPSIQDKDHRYASQQKKKKKKTRQKIVASRRSQNIATEYAAASEQLYNFTPEEIKMLQQFLNPTASDLTPTLPDLGAFVRAVLDNESLLAAISRQLCKDVSAVPATIRGRIRGNVSVLNHHQFEDMKTITMESIVDEFKDKLPVIFDLIVHTMLRQGDMNIPEKFQEIRPLLATIYAIIMKQRNPELSLFQNLVSCSLSASLCDKKTHDLMNRVGISLNYENSLRAVDRVGSQTEDLLQTLFNSDKKLRLIGDNLNLFLHVHNETSGKHDKGKSWDQTNLYYENILVLE